MPTLDIAINSRAAEQSAKSATKSVDDFAVAIDTLHAAVTGVDRALPEVSSELTKTATAAKSAGSQAREAAGRFAATGAAAKAAGVSIGSLSTSFRSATLSMRGFIGGFAAFGVVRSAVTTLGSFEDAMLRMAAVAIRATDPIAIQELQLRSLAETAREMGSQTLFSATEAAQGMGNLARAGFDVREIIAAIPGVLNLAVVASTDLAQSASIVASTIRQFGLDANDSLRVVDALTLASNSADTTLVELSEGLKLAGPIAAAAGMSLEETAAAMAVLADQGLKASVGGTGLRGVLVGLIDPTTAGAKVLRELTSAEREQAGTLRGTLIPQLRELAEGNLQLTQALDLFDRRNVAAGVGLVANVDKLDSLTTSLGGAAGQSQRFSDIIGTGLVARFDELGSAFDEATIKAGERGLLGALKGSVEFLTTGVRSLGEFGGELTTTEAAAQGLVVTLGIGGLIGVLGTLVSFVGPAGLVVVGIAAVVGGLSAWASATDDVTDRMVGLRRESAGLADDLQRVAIDLELATQNSDLATAASAARSQAAILRRQATTFEAQRREDPSLRGVPISALRAVAPSGEVPAVVRDAMRAQIEALRSILPMTERGLGFGQQNTVARREIELLEQAQRQPGAVLPAELTARVVAPFDAAIQFLLERAKALEAEAQALSARAQAVDRKTGQLSPAALERALVEAPAAAQAVAAPQDGPDLGTLLGGLSRGALAAGRARGDEIAEARRAIEGLIEARAEEVRLASLTRAEREREVAVLDAEQEALRAGIELRNAEANAIRDLVSQRQASELRREVDEQFGSDIARSITDPIRQAFLSGETDDLGATLVASLSASFLDNTVFIPLQQALSKVFADVVGETGLSGIQQQTAAAQAGIEITTAGATFSSSVIAAGELFATAVASAAGTSTTAAVVSSTAGAAAKSALGNVLSGGVDSGTAQIIPFAHGGVLQSRTRFPLAGGRVGEAGERGAEAILPLERDSAGRLGVRSQGSGNVTVNDNRRITLTLRDEAQMRRTQRQLESDKRRALAQATEGA